MQQGCRLNGEPRHQFYDIGKLDRPETESLLGSNLISWSSGAPAGCPPRHKDARFLMSFGAYTYANEFQGLWLHIPYIPDLTIDLRVYVPSFGDRLAEEVQLPCCKTLRLSRCALRRCGILLFRSDILYMYLGGNPLNLAYLSSSGIQAVEAIAGQTQITVCTLLGHRKLEICQANLAGRV
jgi:hypothetical protein